MRRLPMSRIARPIHDVAASASVTGIRVWELKTPMLAEATPDIPICKKPSIAAALPMLWSNGTSARAAAFGKPSPSADSEMNSSTSVAGRPNQP